MAVAEKLEIHIRKSEETFYEVRQGDYLVAVSLDPDDAVRLAQEVLATDAKLAERYLSLNRAS